MVHLRRRGAIGWLAALPLAGRAQAPAGGPAGGTPAVDEAESRRLHALLDRAWEESARFFPEWASFRGDHRHGDKLSDVSPAGEQAFDRQVQAWLAEARGIARDRLGQQDRISLDMFIGQNQRLVEQQAFPGWRTMTLGALGGVQNRLADLVQVMPTASKAQVQQLLDRMAAYPAHMDQQIERLRRGIALGFVPSHAVLDRVLQHIDVQLPPRTEDTPFWRPFTRLGPAIPEAERVLLQAAGRRAIDEQVLPALRRLRDFVAGDYRAHARADGAMLHYPDGQRLYALQVAHSTTTRLTPRRIHELGLRELARLRAGMEAVMREQGGTDLKAFIARISTDPAQLAASPEAMLARYREIGKRLDAELPRLFAELPRMPWGVLPMPAYMGSNRAEYYQGPAADGTRAGFFFANTAAHRTRPLWTMETLVAHEAVPGHHLQIARAAELRGLPAFRRHAIGHTAYIEGWAMYAETLGFELGLYRDPLSRFGHLQSQAFRAARLVVDTGLHAFGWPRQRCIDFMVDATGMDTAFMASEVDRYSSWPAQALGYMIGRLRIEALRDRARTALEDRFDIRRFHNLLIDQGALPLDTLEQLADEWIGRESRAG